MKIVVKKKSLPSDFRGLPFGKTILFQDEFSINTPSSLKLKLLLFKDIQDMRWFWTKALCKYEVGTGCVGIVTLLAEEVRDFKIDRPNTKPFMHVDRHYFAVMGLVKTHLGMEVITHESTHAALAYLRRTQGRNAFCDWGDIEEEALCYCTGRIASKINRSLIKNKMYP